MPERRDDPEYLRTCLRQREREMEAVRRITVALQAKTSLDDLLRDTLLTAVETVDADAGSLLLHDPERTELVFRYVIGEKAGELTGSRMPDDQGVVGRVFRNGRAEITHDAPADPEHFRGFDEELGFHTRSMVTVPLKTSAGQALGVLQILNRRTGVFTETDQAVLEILAAQAASAIETANLYEEAKLAFVAKTIGRISHDVVNMLQPSVGGALSLQTIIESLFERLEALKLEHPAPELWPRIDQATEELRTAHPEFVQMVLDGAADVQDRAQQIVEAVRGELTPPQFQLRRATDVVERVLRALQLPARQERIELRLEAPEDLPLAEVDVRALYNAVYNLLVNALDATPPGGTVAVRLSTDAESLRIDVSDTGPGIPPDVLPQLFTERVVTTKPSGTGLGTKIVKRVVDLHGGRIEVQTGDEGTTFTLRLPLCQSG